jgi:hypothetical protein
VYVGVVECKCFDVRMRLRRGRRGDRERERGREGRRER